MLLALLLQASTFLPAPAPVPAATDAPYRAALEAAAAESTLAAEAREALLPSTPAQRTLLRTFLTKGEAQARLTAVLVAGTRHDALARALLRAGCDAAGTNTAVACLLAPAQLPAGTAPALAYLAQDPSRPLPIRAAALARLLEAGRHGAWPLARALFAGGTARQAERPAYADWEPGIRWELPKRLVLVSLNRWLGEHGVTPSTFEPNAAWEAQLEQLDATESLVRAAAAQPSAPPSYAAARLDRAQTLALLDAAAAGDVVAARALPWLFPQAEAILQEAASEIGTPRAAMAASILASRPQ